MPKYILLLLFSDRKMKINIFCLLCATDCPVFEVKAKINVSVSFDVIDRSLTRKRENLQRLTVTENFCLDCTVRERI